MHLGNDGASDAHVHMSTHASQTSLSLAQIVCTLLTVSSFRPSAAGNVQCERAAAQVCVAPRPGGRGGHGQDGWLDGKVDVALWEGPAGRG